MKMKRFTAMLLSLLLVLSSVQVTVYADPAGEDIVVVQSQETDDDQSVSEGIAGNQNEATLPVENDTSIEDVTLDDSEDRIEIDENDSLEESDSEEDVIIQESDEEKEEEEEEQVLTVEDGELVEIPMMGTASSSRFKAEYFMGDSTAYNQPLAELCAEMTRDVSDLSEYFDGQFSNYCLLNHDDTNYAQITSEKKAQYRHTIGYQTLMINGVETNVVAIILQGTTEINEVCLDVNREPKHNFKGYEVFNGPYSFYQCVMDGLSKFRNSHEDLYQKPCIYVVAGHSLGGAAASVVAAHLNNVYGKNKVYAYTFGAIKTVDSGDSNVESGYENIHNIYNYYDTYGPNGKSKLYRASSLYMKFGHTHLFYKDLGDTPGITWHNHDINTYVSAVVSRSEELTYFEKYMGECGDNATWEWTFHSDTESSVDIYGAGSTYRDFTRSDNNWYKGSIWDLKPDITSVTIHEGITTIGDLEFKDLTSLQTIRIPTSVTKIEQCAFLNCSSLQKIIYEGTEKQWNEISIDSVGNDLDGVEIVYLTLCDEHTLVEVAAKAATCNTSGCIAHWKCSVCGDCFSDAEGKNKVSKASVRISALGHDYADGACSRCGESWILSQGDCGPDLHYELYADGTMTFTGSGEMTKAPWLNSGYNNKIKSISFPSGITSIYTGAFKESSVKVITVSDGVTIGKNAFYNCDQLSTVQLGKNVTVLDYAFYNCGVLQKVTVGQGSSIGYGAFSTCKALSTLNLPDSIIIGSHAFESCISLRSFTVKSGTSIGSYAFYGCTALSDLTLTGTATILGDYAFSNTGIVTLSIPEGSQIGSYCFSKCTSLKELTIGNDVTSGGTSAFSGCTALKKITIPIDVLQLDYHFSGCSNVEEIIFTPGITGVSTDRVNYSGNSTYYEKSIGYSAGAGMKKVTFQEGITYIGNYFFYGSGKNLETVVLPETIETIGSYAFYGCSSLGAVDVPSDVSIGEYAFHSCSAMKEATLGENVVTGTYAFAGCTSLEALTLPEHGSLGSYAFADCSSLNNLIVFGEVTVGDYAFTNTTGMTSLTLKGTGGKLGSYAFSGCGVTKLEVPLGWVLGGYCFSKCPALVELTIGKKVKSGGSRVFSECTGLKKITIPIDVLQLDYHFSGCSNVEEIIFTPGITGVSTDRVNYSGNSTYYEKSIGYSAGAGVKKVTFQEGVTYIGNYFFYESGKNLETLVLPESLEEIGSYAFYGCSSLGAVDVSSDIKIGDYAFCSCSGMKEAALGENVVTGTYAFANCTSLEALTLPEHGSLGTYAFANCSSLNNLVVCGGVTVGDYAFTNTTGMTSLTLKGTGGNLGSYAFSGCGVTKLEIPLGWVLGGYCFSKCPALAELTIGKKVKSGGYRVFSECIGLKKITIPIDVLQLDYHFSGCSNVEEIIFTPGITGVSTDRVTYSGNSTYYEKSIGYYAGAGVKKVTFQEGITYIGNYFFYESGKNLETVVLPESLEEIGSYAFSGCNSDLAIKSIAGSYAESYANKNSFAFVEMQKFSITEQPQDATAGVKAKISYSVKAIGAAGYQWQYSKNGTKWYNSSASSAKTDTLLVTVSTSNVTNIYRCKVIGEDGTTLYSDTAGLNLIPGVVITSQPVSVAGKIGQTVTYKVTANNVESYQWLYSKDGTNWYKSGATGCTTDTLSIKISSTNQNYIFKCKMIGTDGNSKNSGKAGAVIVSEQPVPSTVAVGTTASFRVVASNIATYQWQYSKNGGTNWYSSSATGCNTDTVSFKATTSNRTNLYRCKLTTTNGVSVYTNIVGFAE